MNEVFNNMTKERKIEFATRMAKEGIDIEESMEVIASIYRPMYDLTKKNYEFLTKDEDIEA